MPGPTTIKEQSNQNKLEFLYELYNRGIPISSEDKTQLRQAGFIPFIKDDDDPEVDDQIIGKSNEADDFVNIVFGVQKTKDKVVVVANEEFQKEIQESIFSSSNREIEKSDWMPESNIFHKQDFVDWIDSINSGFQRMVRYDKFELYCEQAEIWKANRKNISQLRTKEEIREFKIEEARRCDVNSLYFMDVYLKVKEADQPNGYMDYEAKPVHKVLCYIFDCGYSFTAGKPRQIAATTTIGGLAIKRLILNKNYFVKFIAQDDLKVKEIFEDKVKYPFSELPKYLRPKTFNDRDNMISFKSKSQKGKIDGLNSVLRVVAPSVAAINGGSPNLVLIDEAGYIGILGKMLKEARPTLFRQNPITKKIEMTRQIIFWGTGGEMDKGGKSFEDEYMHTMKMWKNGDYKYGIVPLFFDWTTRPGITKEFYDSELKNYTVEGPEKESKMVQFKQAYPSVIEDMFLSSHKTLISSIYVNERIEKIDKIDKKHKPVYGYFEPIYDTSKPMHERSDTPYEIVGSNFIPCEPTNPMCSSIIFMHPKPFQKNRYYAGSDPVSSDNGISKMSTSIFDKKLKTISCVVNFRSSSHKSTFLQCYLSTLYYSTSKTGTRIKELVEANVAQNYIDYVEEKGGVKSFIYNAELPDSLRGGGVNIGIDNHRGRSRAIISKMTELFITYGERIYIREIWEQHRTFVVTITEDMNESWGSMDKRKYPDDILYSSTYSYICALSDLKEPIDEDESKIADKKKFKSVIVRDKNNKLRRKVIRR